MPSALTGVAQPPPTGTIYRVTTPQGMVYDRYQRGQAEQILAQRGGSLAILHPDE